MQDSSGEQSKKHSFKDVFRNPFRRSNPSLEEQKILEAPDNQSRREFLKKSTQAGIGVAALATVGIGADRLASANSAKAEGTKTPESILNPTHYCTHEVPVEPYGDWAVPVGKTGEESLAMAQSAGIEIDQSSEFVRKSYEVANNLLREVWKIPEGITIYIGVWQDTIQYYDSNKDQWFEANASTRRNWEDPEPKPEARILLSKKAYEWPGEVFKDVLIHEIGHALKALYFDANGGASEHNSDQNSVMFWIQDRLGRMPTQDDFNAIDKRFKNTPVQPPTPTPSPTPQSTPQPPRPENMPFEAKVPGIAKD